mmetsp:Transcript_8352/g.25083  ORF Transcript_8352/g.25083 Transcript_8352/m.25083 type:complete len:518 (+) Transcript_8352:166-1719(+)
MASSRTVIDPEEQFNPIQSTDDDDTGPLPTVPERNVTAIVCALGATLGAVGFGYSLGFSSPALPGMIGRFFGDAKCKASDDDDTATVTSDMASLWSSIINVGCMGGALAGARVLDALGRRGTLAYFAGPLYVAAWALTAQAQSAGVLIAARLVLGLGVGVCSVAVPVYIAETAPPALRGALGASNQLAVTVGIFLVYLVGFLEPHETLEHSCGKASSKSMKRGKWRELAWLGALLGAALVVVACLIPESPPWLVRRGRTDAALRSLETLRGAGERARDEAEALAAAAQADSGEAAMTVGELAAAVRSDPGVREPLKVAAVVMLVQQFSGINAVIFFSGDILAAAGMPDRDLGGVIVMAIQVVMTGVAVVLMDRAGRRALLAASLGGMTFAAALMAVYFAFLESDEASSWVAVLALALYISFFSIGLGPIPWLLMPEILPQRARGVASAAATLLNWTCSFAVTMSFANLLDVLTPQGAFLLFAAVCCAGGFYVIARVPETKGLTLDEISEVFRRRAST